MDLIGTEVKGVPGKKRSTIDERVPVSQVEYQDLPGRSVYGIECVVNIHSPVCPYLRNPKEDIVGRFPL